MPHRPAIWRGGVCELQCCFLVWVEKATSVMVLTIRSEPSILVMHKPMSRTEDERKAEIFAPAVVHMPSPTGI